jgi:inhibitor of cysteine peptidase
MTANSGSTDSGPLQLDESVNGHEVSRRVHQYLELSLAENPTTGFRWQMQLDGSPACTLRSDTNAAPAEGGVGKGGTHRFLFEAVRSGTCQIRLVYSRSWEAKAPDRTLEFRVRVIG